MNTFARWQRFSKHLKCCWYTKEFYKLLAHNDTQEFEEQLVARYIGGLSFPILDEVECIDFGECMRLIN